MFRNYLADPQTRFVHLRRMVWIGRSLLVAIICLFRGVSCFGQTFWTDGTGNWNTASNWSLGVPNSLSATAFDAVIENGGTAQLIGPPAGSVRRLRVGRAAGTGNLLVDGTTLTVTQDLYLNENSAGASSMTVQDGSIVSAPTTSVGQISAANTSFLISGAGTSYAASTQFIVGNSGAGTASLTVDTGAALTSGIGIIANGSGSVGIATVTSSGSSWSTTGAFTVGGAGVGTLNIQNQGSVSVGTALSINNTSAVNVNGGTLRFDSVSGLSHLSFTSGTIQLAGNRDQFDATIATLFGSTIPSGKNLTIEGNATAESFTVSGGTLTSQHQLQVGLQLNASLTIQNGGVVNSVDGLTGSSSGNAFIDIRGVGSTWQVSHDLVLNSIGVGFITVEDHGVLFVGNNLYAASGGNITVRGGTLRLNTINGLNNVTFDSGTIQLSGSRSLGGSAGDSIVSNFFGSAPTIDAGKELAVEGTSTLLGTVTINGGAFTTGNLQFGQNLQINSGTLNLTNQALVIGSGGLFGDSLDINDNVTINVSLGTTNQGLLTGDGQLGGTLTNTATAELRADPGKSLTLTGSGNSNAGRIQILGGLLDFHADLTNNAGGFISGNGSLIVSGGLTNNGVMNFAGTANLVGHVTNSATGKIISGGGGATVFYDDVVNQGEIRTSTNGFTVFYGSVSGGGTFTGTGTVNFEGDLSPGNSPAAINFGGDVVLGPGSTLKIEIGGTTAGSQYDQINVAGKLNLDGTLIVQLTNGFTPTVGQTFDILNSGSLAGSFSSLQLPTVAGLVWNTSQLSSGVLSLAIPGDFNFDGIVDAADYVVWRKTDGSSQGYDTWRTHYGEPSGSGSGASASATVPEPAALVLLMFAAAGWCFRRGRAG